MVTSPYPATLPTYTTKIDKVDLVDDDHINQLQFDLVALATEVGTDVGGSATDLKSRLARSINDAGGMRMGTSFPVSPAPADGDFFYRSDQDIVYLYDGATWDAQSGITNYAAGDYLIAGPGQFKSNYIPNSSYEKIDEFYVPRSGTLRIKFWLKSQAGVTAYGRIYRNGSAVGTERSTTSTTLTEYSEDLASWAAGDLVQLYTKVGTGGNPLSVGAMRIYENVPVTEVPMSTKVIVYWGSGVPDAGLATKVGDLYLRSDGGASTTLYVSTGVGTWTAK